MAGNCLMPGQVTYRWSRGGPPRPLLIKSPVHTARLRIWLKLFPNAKFVYIHRHPIEVRGCISFRCGGASHLGAGVHPIVVRGGRSEVR